MLVAYLGLTATATPNFPVYTNARHVAAEQCCHIPITVCCKRQKMCQVEHFAVALPLHAQTLMPSAITKQNERTASTMDCTAPRDQNYKQRLGAEIRNDMLSKCAKYTVKHMFPGGRRSLETPQTSLPPARRCSHFLGSSLGQ